MNQRTTSDIERDIARTRAEMSETIDALQHRLSPGQMFEQLLHYSGRFQAPFALLIERLDPGRDAPERLDELGMGAGPLVTDGGRRERPRLPGVAAGARGQADLGRAPGRDRRAL